MKPLSIWQRILFQLGITAVQYPERCGLCGKKTRGNAIIGYRHRCKC